MPQTMSAKVAHMIRHKEVADAVRRLANTPVDDPDNPPSETVEYICKGKRVVVTLGGLRVP